MKKIKFMLMSLALLAVVGGALAFKAKYQSTFCTVKAVNDALGNSTCIDPNTNLNLKCTDKVAASTTVGTDLDAAFYCTAPAFNKPGVGLTCTSDNVVTDCGATTYTTIVGD